MCLRINNGGGITLFRPGFRDGAGVIRDQDAKPLEIPAATKSQAADKAVALGQQLSRVGRTALVITLQAPSLAENSEAWAAMADPVAIVDITLKRVMSDTLGREAVATKVERVLIRDAGHISIALDGRTLVVQIDADRPLVGRPSSKRLETQDRRFIVCSRAIVEGLAHPVATGNGPRGGRGEYQQSLRLQLLGEIRLGCGTERRP
jgi:hypothetical protein